MQEWSQILEGVELAGSFTIDERGFTVAVFPGGSSRIIGTEA